MATRAKQAKAEKPVAKASTPKAKAEPAAPKAKHTPSKAKASKESPVGVRFDPTAMLNDDMDSIAKRMHMREGGIDPGEPMSTGNLSLDLVEAGGIRPGWYTHFGPEQSCKTTGALVIMAAAVKACVSAVAFKDYEGSTANSLDYVQSILKTQGVNKSVNELFGERDDKSGKWITRPIVRYSEETIGERFFDWLAELLQRLPDKKRIAGKWWLIYEDNKINKAKLGEYSNKTMASKYGSGIYIEAEDGRLQGLVITDSYPGMNPAANDEEEANNGLALQARMFSKHLPRVKGRLSSKRVAVIGINQLRAIPMARYGPTEMEPCGQALRYNSDCRLKFTPRALSAAARWWPKPAKRDDGNGFDSTNEAEPSVEVPGGFDTYRYIHVKAEKNKMSPPKRSGWIRLWIEDAHGIARGFDPVFDTMHYLRSTGQLKGKGRKSLNLVLHDQKNSGKIITWDTLKQWVLGDKKTMSEISTKYGYKPMSLRAFCFKQVKDGVSETLYNEVKGNAKSKNADSEDDGEE